MGTYLSVQDLSVRTKVTGLKDAEGAREQLAYWIDLAEALLNTFNLDSSLTGFASIAAFATQKVAEHLFVSNEEQIVIVANSPFRSERLGSYSYNKGPKIMDQKKEMFADFPVLVQVAISRITKEIIPLSIYSSVFREEKSGTVTGVREYQDMLDVEIARIDDSKGTFEVGNS